VYIVARFLYYFVIIVWALGASIPLFLMFCNRMLLLSSNHFSIWHGYNRNFCRIFFRIHHVQRSVLDAKKQYVFLPNHHSSLDGCLVYLCHPVSVVALVKDSLKRIPFLGRCFWMLGFVFVNRAKKSSLTEHMIALLNDTELSLLLFPEGTRNYVPRTLNELRTGAFVIACNAGVPIVPIRYNILDKVNDRQKSFAWKQKTYVVFGAPIETKDRDLNDVMEEYRRFHDTELAGWDELMSTV
jgi:1-acyl-sn-glycerol-3-phosphate acyltransferase